MQWPIDAILELVREHHIVPDQIQKIEIAILEAGWGIVCEPRERKYHPESVVDAQFSMPFGAAVAVACGAAGLDQFTLEQIRSSHIRQIMNQVVLANDAQIEETFPKEWPARVTIHLAGGLIYERFVRYPKGDPENPLTWDEMAAKFRALAGAVLPSKRCDEIINRVRAGNLTNLAALCAA
jgi:2-methylcitrate dehydratase PrpD